MIFVVDTSVAVKWFVAEADTEQAQLLLGPELELAAPDLLIAEVGNVLWRKQRAGQIDADQVDEAVQRLPGFFQRLTPSSELTSEALRIARDIGHSLYDCVFLAQAASLPDGRLVTADARFVAKASVSSYAALLRPLSDFSLSRDM